jgi:DNA-binding CsgD family transcriptional regulator
LRRPQSRKKAKQTASLSKREVECLLWCGRGKTNAEVARQLGLSARTIEHYMASAVRKLGARNRTEAVYRAVFAGFLVGPDEC